MNISLLHRTDALILSVFLFLGMVLMVVLGRMAGRMAGQEAEQPKGGVNSLLTALFALSGFILGFTFGMSGNRLERIRVVVQQEVNDIGTAILRADLYSDSARNGFRADFRNYVEAVIASYDNENNPDLLSKAKADAAKAAENLWARATRQSKLPNMLIPSNNMITALNDMFDIAQTREIVLKARVPDLIVYMLFICILTSCFIGGFTSEAFHKKDWIIIIGFALVTSMVVYTTLDLGRPTRGMIKERAGRDAILELRQIFKDYR